MDLVPGAKLRLLIVATGTLLACGGKAAQELPAQPEQEQPDGSAGGTQSAPPETFQSGEPLNEFWLWMGTDIPEDPQAALPVEPGKAADDLALHVAGMGDAESVDTYLHTPFPVEAMFSGVRFSAKSDRGNQLIVTIGGPSPNYWVNIAMGMPWAASAFQLTSEWQTFEVRFEDLGYGPNSLAPFSSPFGAVHFIMQPSVPYDLWLDDVQLVER